MEEKLEGISEEKMEETLGTKNGDNSTLFLVPKLVLILTLFLALFLVINQALILALFFHRYSWH
jgi:hypothetical protein